MNYSEGVWDHLFFFISAYQGLKTQINIFKYLGKDAYHRLKTQINSYKEVEVNQLI